MSRIADALAAVIAPDRCLHCRSPSRPGALLCGVCLRALPWLPVDGCRRCGLPRRCRPQRCPARRAAFDVAWAPLAYEGPACSLAWANKQHATRRVSRWLAATMTVRVPQTMLEGAVAVVPVPADAGRRRRRGADHAAVLARATASRLGLPVAPILVRTGATASGPAQHRQGRRGRSEVPVPEVVGTVPASLILVDDVHTTGATLDAAARALRAAGARRIVALTAFRTDR